MTDTIDDVPQPTNELAPGESFTAVAHDGITPGLCAVVYEGALVFVGPIDAIPVCHGCQVYLAPADAELLMGKQQAYMEQLAAERQKMN